MIGEPSGGGVVGTFKAILIEKANGGQKVGLVDFDEKDLMDGDVTVRVEWSTLNYKDGLALTGKAPVVRRFPMIPGVDLVGTVEASASSAWKRGDRVILNGWGLGETHLGAYAGKARVKADWLVPLPDGMRPREAMAIGTAGYTAMLSVMALERHGITPERGPVVVTGAAGGVGSVAVAILAKLGYRVIAATGRTQEADYLEGLGAAEIVDRQDLAGTPRPLAKERWAAGIDFGRLHDARQRALDDPLRRGGCGLRPRGRDGLAIERCTFHLARGFVARDRFCHVPTGFAARGLETLGFRPRTGKA